MPSSASPSRLTAATAGRAPARAEGGMWKIYVGNLDSRVRERELADEFRAYGNVRSVWVARNPPGYAFVELDDRRDAEDAIAALDGKHGWRVEMSKKSVGYSETKCYECGSSRHFARDCHYKGSRRSYRRSPSPYSRSSGRSRDDLSPRYDRRSSSRGSPQGGGRNYDRPSGSERSESRGSNKRRRERSVSLEDTKSHVKSPQGHEFSKSPEVNNPEFDGSEREAEQSKSPLSDRSDMEGSPAIHERSRSPIHQISSADGLFSSPVTERNGKANSESPTEKNEFDLENDSSPVTERNGKANSESSTEKNEFDLENDRITEFEHDGDADPKDMERESS